MSRRICPECERTSDQDLCPDCGNPTVDETHVIARDDPLLGRTLGGRYRVETLLGRGGMGRVYVAEQTAMKRQVALKVIRTQDTGEMSERMAMVRRFQREAMAVSRLEHHHTVRVFDFGTAEDGTLFLAMELLRGSTLTKGMSLGPIPPRRAVSIAIQVCKSLAEAHGKGIVHRDLKPDNIMLVDAAGEKDFVKVLDFGIAKIAATTAESSITRTGMVMGTPAYMAPEQAKASGVSPATDLYSLGVILYEALTGRVPFTGATPLAILMMHTTAEVPPMVVDGFPADVPQGLADLVVRLLEKDPARRPGSALELISLLEAVDFSGPRVEGVRLSGLKPLPATAPGEATLRTQEGSPVFESAPPSSPLAAVPEPTRTVDATPRRGTLHPVPLPDVVAPAVVPASARPGKRPGWMIGAGLGAAVLAVGVFLWAGSGTTESGPEPEPAPGPVMPAPAAVPGPTAEPARPSPAPMPVVTPASLPASPRAGSVPEPEKPAPKVERAAAPKPGPAKAVLPACVRSKCPIKGECVDGEGRRLNGRTFCRDIAI